MWQRWFVCFAIIFRQWRQMDSYCIEKPTQTALKQWTQWNRLICKMRSDRDERKMEKMLVPWGHWWNLWLSACDVLATLGSRNSIVLLGEPPVFGVFISKRWTCVQMWVSICHWFCPTSNPPPQPRRTFTIPTTTQNCNLKKKCWEVDLLKCWICIIWGCVQKVAEATAHFTLLCSLLCFLLTILKKIYIYINNE